MGTNLVLIEALKKTGVVQEQDGNRLYKNNHREYVRQSAFAEQLAERLQLVGVDISDKTVNSNLSRMFNGGPIIRPKILEKMCDFAKVSENDRNILREAYLEDSYRYESNGVTIDLINSASHQRLIDKMIKVAESFQIIGESKRAIDIIDVLIIHLEETKKITYNSVGYQSMIFLKKGS